MNTVYSMTLKMLQDKNFIKVHLTIIFLSIHTTHKNIAMPIIMVLHLKVLN